MEWNLSPVTHDSPVTHGAPLTHAERTAGTHWQREEEEERVGGAGYPVETECPGLQLDTEAPVGVTAKWCSVARRVAIDRLNSPSSGGNAKTPRLIARNSPAKQSSTTYHFINLSSLCESPPSIPPPLLLIRTLRLQISLKSVTNSPPPPPLARSGPSPLNVLSSVKASFSPRLRSSPPTPSLQVRTTRN